MNDEAPDIDVLIPCRNEARTVAQVVRSLRTALPRANIKVYDDASEDATAEAALAADARAVVRHIARSRGKGAVVRTMLAESEGALAMMIDGDDTYAAHEAALLVETLKRNKLDMVSARRIAPAQGPSPWPPGHRWGNQLIAWTLRALFQTATRDPLSGYRIMTRALAQSFEPVGDGFTVETELVVHAALAGAATAEVALPYRARPKGSESKLRTVRDGLRIAATIARLAIRERTHWMLTGAAAGALAWAVFAAATGATRQAWTTAALGGVAGLAALWIRARHRRRRRR